MESNVISEDYCSYEVAKLLKEKGFPFDRLEGGWQRLLNLNVMEAYTTVTHAIARKWLRERHIIIVIVPEYFNSGQCTSWDIDIWVDGDYKHPFEDYPTYEEAVDSALKYCLTEIL